MGYVVMVVMLGLTLKVVERQVMIACSKGGTSIEDLAEKYPKMIIKVRFLFFCYLLAE